MILRIQNCANSKANRPIVFALTCAFQVLEQVKRRAHLTGGKDCRILFLSYVSHKLGEVSEPARSTLTWQRKANRTSTISLAGGSACYQTCRFCAFQSVGIQDCRKTFLQGPDRQTALSSPYMEQSLGQILLLALIRVQRYER